MNKHLILPQLAILALLLLSGGKSLGQQADSLPASGVEIENALFWEISGNGLETPSYLFGTIHLIPKDSFFILPVMEEKLKMVDRLVLEVEMNTQAIFGSMMGILLPRDKPLRKLLSEEDYAYLKEFVRDSLPEGGMPLPMIMVDMIKPIFTAQAISSAMCESEMQEQVSYELYLTDLFQKSDRPVSGLETAGEQIAALDAIPLEEQAAQLMEAVRNPREMCGQFDDMVGIYRRQDLKTLMEMTEGDAGIGDHLESLLDKRNKNWIPKIDEMARKEVLLIAVGAGHLAGENGVVNLLRKAGFVVNPLSELASE